MFSQGSAIGWVVLAAVVGSACSTVECNAAGCLGRNFELALLNEDGSPATGARGKINYSSHGEYVFDCTLSPEPPAEYIDCEDGVLEIASVYGRDDELSIRFEREDGGSSDWQPVALTKTPEVLRDFNGPECDCTIYQGSAEPITVPSP